MYTVFIVEDDQQICGELATLLQRNGYAVKTATDFRAPSEEILRCAPDLVLLDLNLPCLDGHVICRELRMASEVPIIVVTSRDSDLDELMSMSLGADDFIVKPYNAPILLARIARILQRTHSDAEQSILAVGEVELDLARSLVNFAGHQAELTKNELRILRLLMRTPGCIVSRADIQNELWQSDEFIDDNTLTVNVNRLRGTLAGIGLEGFLLTRRGQGYLVEEQHGRGEGRV